MILFLGNTWAKNSPKWFKTYKMINFGAFGAFLIIVTILYLVNVLTSTLYTELGSIIVILCLIIFITMHFYSKKYHNKNR